MGTSTIVIPAERVLDEQEIEENELDVERKPSMWDNQVILNTFVAGRSRAGWYVWNVVLTL